uniref:Uncharacterized protein n=1 Tax=Nelumbo nucifera TaxID=4432 RepID=A0A822Y6C2_NELNU|nr:TPA_asm: hypothetical protein HUJ06_029250 [Nelumbo nucifera]
MYGHRELHECYLINWKLQQQKLIPHIPWKHVTSLEYYSVPVIQLQCQTATRLLKSKGKTKENMI